MKRLHVSISVSDFERSVSFYSAMFGTGPTERRPDFAKWRLREPAVNFAIQAGVGTFGVDHLGVEMDGSADVSDCARRVGKAGGHVVEQEDARCCYARSDKAWAADPDGVAWELFATHERLDEFGEDRAPASLDQAAAQGAEARETGHDR